MNFLKPKFWDRKQISFFAIFLFPISLCIKLTSYFKFIFGTKQSFPIPIICVGNIYLGGTGKTPFCIELFSILKKLNKNPVFIRKKYESFQDEINILKNIGDTYENKKRTIALKDAIKSKFNIAVLDDGLSRFFYKKRFINCLLQ
jgi:tetraacyldisaccharide 4'-kinase